MKIRGSLFVVILSILGLASASADQMGAWTEGEKTWVSIYVENIKDRGTALSTAAEFRLLMLAADESGFSSYFVHPDDGMLKISRDEPLEIPAPPVSVPLAGGRGSIPVYLVAVDRDTKVTEFHDQARAFLDFAEGIFPRISSASGASVIDDLKAAAQTDNRTKIVDFIDKNNFFGESFFRLKIDDRKHLERVMQSGDGRLEYTLRVDIEGERLQGRIFVVQVFASPDEKNTRRVVKTFEMMGYPGFVTQPKAAGDVFYRAHIGRFKSRSEAEGARLEIAKKIAASDLKKDLGSPFVTDVLNPIAKPLGSPTGTPPAGSGPEDKYIIQLGSFANKNRAYDIQLHVNKILELSGNRDHETSVKSKTRADGLEMFRVRVEYFSDNADANHVKQLILERWPDVGYRPEPSVTPFYD